MITIELLPLKRLTDADVRQLIMDSVDLVKETRDDLHLPLFTTIEATGQRLEHGTLRADRFRVRRSGNVIAKTYGYFKAPSTIVLDENLLIEGQRFHQTELATTATYYSAVHEVIHADDYTNGNRIVQGTLHHIQKEHAHEIADAAEVLAKYTRGRWGRSPKAITNTWTYQYIDSATHYRTYMVLKHQQFPQVETVWVSLYNSIFSPRLFTGIEQEKGLHYTSDLLSEQIGRVCMVEIAEEFEKISQKKTRTYTI